MDWSDGGYWKLKYHRWVCGPQLCDPFRMHCYRFIRRDMSNGLIGMCNFQDGWDSRQRSINQKWREVEGLEMADGGEEGSRLMLLSVDNQGRVERQARPGPGSSR